MSGPGGDAAGAAGPLDHLDPAELDPRGLSLGIEGTWNARDAATLTGLRPGVLLRTAALVGLTETGRDRLVELGVTDVVDLRSDLEAENQGGDAVPPGVTVHRLPITPGGALAGQIAGRGSDPAAMARFVELVQRPGFAHDLMAEVYREIVTAPDAVAQLGRALTVLARAEGGVVVHCSAGKDRTGVLVALAALLAGADTAAVEADFAYSTHAAAAQRAVVPAVPGIDPELLAPIFGVDVDSLRGALADVIERHGDLVAFARDAGLEADDLERLRSRLAP
ncbi:tyrosine-protein phosphatase [Litorihabitans aurantiacus]|uniref:Phosphotyrosine protein phosphatase n=1 Tax=Litorihabitans aurantiacus TaxID=1930061 RepID=A0AA37XDV3_9MICO|nr:tyrosine-protein phosphatase [Litorihabitans aurantiacus]GMA31307.1 phosphotyrosine protein phosphatase [Litorihabitans aurantiacus]